MGNYQTNRGLEQAIKSNRGKGGGYSNQYSLNFDGIDNYVNCRNGSNYQFTTAITLSAWVKPAVIDPSPSCRIIDKYDTSPYSGWSLWQSTATPGKWRGTFGILEPSSPTAIRTQVEFAVPSTDWQHITVTFNGLTGDLKLYHNGSLVNTDTNAPGSIINTNTEEIIIGASSITAGYYDGNIDEVAIWDVALDDATIESIFNDGTPNSLKLSKSYTAGGGIDNSGDLKAWWRMGDSGIYFNNNWEIPEQTKIDNFSSHSMEFDGIDAIINIDSFTSVISITTVGTLSVWVRPVNAVPSTNERILCFGDSTSLDYLDFYGTNVGRIRLDCRIGGVYQYRLESNASPIFTDNEWTHIVIVQDGVIPVIYIDGSIIVTTNILGATPSAWFSDFVTPVDQGRIGNYPGGTGPPAQFYEGSIDGVSIWDEALTSGNVTSIFADGVPNNVTGLGINGLIGYWHMGDDATWNSLNWIIPDSSTNSNPGLSGGMGIEAKINNAPDNENQGLSDGMGENAPSGRSPDVPPTP